MAARRPLVFSVGLRVAFLEVLVCQSLQKECPADPIMCSSGVGWLQGIVQNLLVDSKQAGNLFFGGGETPGQNPCQVQQVFP